MQLLKGRVVDQHIARSKHVNRCNLCMSAFYAIILIEITSTWQAQHNSKHVDVDINLRHLMKLLECGRAVRPYSFVPYTQRTTSPCLVINWDYKIRAESMMQAKYEFWL